MHEAMALGKLYTADEALGRGIVQNTCLPADLLPTAMSLARDIISNGGFNRKELENMKRDVYTTFQPSKESLPKL